MCHVLVIEDDDSIAMIVADMVELGGATSVVQAATERTAIAAARQMPPAVIISDVDLKQGGKGPLAVEAIRAELGPVPVIFLTATPHDCDPCDYAHAIITKPMNMRAFLETFAQVAPTSNGMA